MKTIFKCHIVSLGLPIALILPVSAKVVAFQNQIDVMLHSEHHFEELT